MHLIFQYIKPLLNEHTYLFWLLILFMFFTQTLILVPTLIVAEIMNTLQRQDLETALTQSFIFCIFIIINIIILPLQQRFRDHIFNTTNASIGIHWCRTFLEKDYAFFEILTLDLLQDLTIEDLKKYIACIGFS